MLTIIAWPRMMGPELATEYVGGSKIFGDLEKKELIKPRVQGKGCTRYDRVELDAGLDAWKGFDPE
jgi:hypothetical protein